MLFQYKFEGHVYLLASINKFECFATAVSFSQCGNFGGSLFKLRSFSTEVQQIFQINSDKNKFC